MNEKPSKPLSRSQSFSHGQSAADFQSKSNRSFQTNLESINEETNPKPVVPAPTKVDAKRDIQVLTLNDDGNTNQPSANEAQDEVPF